jgi:hypothetical protein
MPGIKLTELPIDNSVNDTDAFLKVKNGTSYQVSGSTFINQFSGLNSGLNLGAGSTVLNISETTPTVLKFNSVIGLSPIQASNNISSKTIEISVIDNSITGNKLADGTIPSSKLATNAVTNSSILAGAVTPDKQSGVRYARATKTDVQTIAANGSAAITGLSVTVTPVSTNSLILVGGYVTVGAVNGYMNLRKTVNGTTTNLAIGDNTNIGNRTRATLAIGRSGDDRTALVVPINFYDVAGTTSPITYSVFVGDLRGNTIRINANYNDLNDNDNVRATSQLTALVFP